MKDFLHKCFSYSSVSIAVFIILNPFSFAFADITFPKYFFSSEIRKDCLMVGYHGDNSFKNRGTLLKLDLTYEENRTYLKEFINYDWTEDHDKRSNSLTVFSEEILNRTSLISGSLINSVIDNSFEMQSKAAASILIDWAKNEVMLDTINAEDIVELTRQGKLGECYNGQGEVKAKCTWHTAQEAARYAGQFTIIASTIKEFFSETERETISNYIENLYRRHIKTWERQARHEENIGYYQMADGGISVLAYAHWTRDKVLAEKEFSRGFLKIDKLWYLDGYINNNSFRGVRDLWYHTLGLNNALGYVALASQWGVEIPEKVTKKLTNSALVHKIGVKSIEVFRKRKFSGYLGNSTFNKKYAREHTHQHAPFIDWLEINFTDLVETKFLENDKVWQRKKRYNYTDRMLGFNPSCMVQDYIDFDLLLNETKAEFKSLSLLRRKVIQEELKLYGYTASIDGSWGEATEKAALRFIKENFLNKLPNDIIGKLLLGN